MKGEISEIILTVGILIATSITLFLLRPLIFKQSEISQDQVISEFSTDIETTISRATAATNDVSFTYKPLPQKYIFTVSNNIIVIQDKITGKSISFSKEGNAINNVCFEDAQKIYVKKINQNIDITPDSNVGCGGISLSTTTSTTIASTCQEKIISCPENICLVHIGNQKCIEGYNKYYNEIEDAIILENLQDYTGTVENAIYLVASIIGTESGWDQETSCIAGRGCGIMQVTRNTAESSCSDIGTWEEIGSDTIKNIRCGIRVLKNKFSQLDNYASLGYDFKEHGTSNYIKSALAAYNGGAALVFEAVKDTGSTNWYTYGNLDSLTIGARKYDVCVTGDPYCESQGYDCYQCKAAVIRTYVNIKAGQYYDVWPQCQKESVCTTSQTTTTISTSVDFTDKIVGLDPGVALDIVFVPLGFTEEEINSYYQSAKFVYDDFLAKSPFKDCPNGRERVNAYFIRPKDCQNKKCDNFCGNCITNAKECAISNGFEPIFDVVVGITIAQNKGVWGCRPSGAKVLSADYARSQVGIHEFGHRFGLGHIDLCEAPGGKECSGCDLGDDICNSEPNSADCNQDISYIMDYCDGYNKFGPSAYNYLKTDRVYGLAKWLEGCN